MTTSYGVKQEYRFDRSRQADWTLLKFEAEADTLMHDSKARLA